MGKEKCALCRKSTSLKKSHIIPKFVSKWLKKTSATGFLRGFEDPSKRKQDVPHLPLLCGNCEQNFSKLENYFAKNIFYPLLNEQKSDIYYDDRLVRFIISLSWRTLKTSYEDQVESFPWIKTTLDIAEEIWRKYLLGESLDKGVYEHHLLVFDYVKEETGMPKKFQWYSLRATDSTLVSDQKIVFTFTHFPHLFFISTIYPANLKDWKNTQIKDKGKLFLNWQIDDGEFRGFLISRSNRLISKIEEADDKKILKSMLKDGNRLLKSESLKVMLEESKRERKKKIKKIPKGIQALIEIIDGSVDNPEYDFVGQRWVNYTQHMVASALSNLPITEAQKIESTIESTIIQSGQTQMDTECDFETSKIIGKFMVTICKSRKKQIEILNDALNSMIKKRVEGDQRLLVVFSFNPLDKKMPYQTAYYTG